MRPLRPRRASWVVVLAVLPACAEVDGVAPAIDAPRRTGVPASALEAEAAEASQVLSVADLADGDLVITELAGHRVRCEAPRHGHYVEVRNVSAHTVDLAGLGVRTSVRGLEQITRSVRVPPGDYVVLRDHGAPRLCPVGASLEVRMRTAWLVRQDLVRLERPDGSLIDEVDFRAWTFGGPRHAFVPGHALHALVETGTGNDVPSAWCVAGPVMTGGDHGTPGAPSTGCWTPPPPASCDPGSPLPTDTFTVPIPELRGVVFTECLWACPERSGPYDDCCDYWYDECMAQNGRDCTYVCDG